MPIRRIVLLVWLALGCSHSLGAERLSLQLAGGYTELDNVVDVPGALYPIVPNPLDPTEVIELPPVDTRYPLRFDDDDVGWEASLSYRLWRNVHVIAGYGELGDFDSEPTIFGFVVSPPIDPFPGNPFRPIGDGVPLRPIGEPLPAPTSVFTNEVSLDTSAWLLGVKISHALSDRADVYVRLAGLRASFELDSTFQRPFEFHSPSDRTGWAWGVGARYRVLPRVAVGVAFSENARSTRTSPSSKRASTWPPTPSSSKSARPSASRTS